MGRIQTQQPGVDLLRHTAPSKSSWRGRRATSPRVSQPRNAPVCVPRKSIGNTGAARRRVSRLHEARSLESVLLRARSGWSYKAFPDRTAYGRRFVPLLAARCRSREALLRPGPAGFGTPRKEAAGALVWAYALDDRYMLNRL